MQRISSMQDGGFSGRVTIATRDNVLYDKVVGSPGGDVFYVASVSKPFTAVAMLKLIGSGAVASSDRIGRYLPSWPQDDPTTIHHLLSHTSGLAQGYTTEGILDREDAVSAIYATTRRFAPGERFGYSNENYVLAAIVIETVSGDDFVSFLRSQVLEPAGLERTRYWDEPSSVGSEEADLLNPFTGVDRSAWGFRGANGLLSNSFEIVSWLQAILAGDVLSSDLAEEFWRGQAEIDDDLRATYGGFLSPSIVGSPTYWIRGTDSSGGNAVAVYYRDENLILAMTTGSGPPEGQGVPYYNVQIRTAFEETILRAIATQQSH